MSYLTMDNVSKTYAANTALYPLNLALEQGELVTLLGPSGCGKTTLLRIAAGFTAPSSGQVRLAGRDLTRLPAARRQMGMVFQAYSLFPNLNAEDNVRFGLKVRGVGREASRRTLDRLFDMIGLNDLRTRFPHQLSGGQQQRIALARALAIEPQVLLLDEPLSALDAQVRLNLRDEIRRVQRETGTTTLFVTHDQEEALAISDRVAVMEKGRLAQLGTPEEIYRQPATPFVAEFIGASTGLSGQISDPQTGLVQVPGLDIPLRAGRPLTGYHAGDPVRVYLRPEELQLWPAEQARPGGLSVQVNQQRFMGAVTRVRVQAGAHLLDVDLPGTQAQPLFLSSAASLSIPPQAVHVVRDAR